MAQIIQDQNSIDLEPIAPTSIHKLEVILDPLGSDRCRTDLKDSAFYLWYNSGKPKAMTLLDAIKATFTDIEKFPSAGTINNWVIEFRTRADDLDRQMHEQLDAAIVGQKVEMLRRHARIGVKMQDVALAYLDDHAEEISPGGAIRLLVEGVRIERESSGIPEALEKMTKLSDEQLLEQIKQLATSSSVTLEEE